MSAAQQIAARDARALAALVRSEARSLRTLAIGVLVVLALVVTGVNARWDVTPGVLEPERRQIWLALAALATLPVLAESFGRDGQPSGSGWARPLPVRSVSVFAARMGTLCAFASIAFVLAMVADLTSAHAFHGSERAVDVTVTALQVSEIGVARAGITALALVAAFLIVLWSRHAVAATVAALAVVVWCAASFTLDQMPNADEPLGLPLLVTRVVIVPMASSLAGVLVVLATVALSFRVRGTFERSVLHRGVTIVGAGLGAVSFVAAADGDPLRANDRALFHDATAHVRSVEPTADGRSLVLTLGHGPGRPSTSAWSIDVATGEPTRIVVPGEAGYGAFASLVGVAPSRYAQREDVVRFQYGRIDAFGSSRGEASGEFTLDLVRGETCDLRPGPIFTWRDRWNPRVVKVEDDGKLVEEWRREDEVSSIVTRRMPTDQFVQAERVSHRIAIYGVPGAVRLIDLEAGTERRTDVFVESARQEVRLSPYDDQWLLVQDEERRWCLVDTVNGDRHRLPRCDEIAWTRRDDSSVLVTKRSERTGRVTFRALFEPTSAMLHRLDLEGDVDLVRDIDGERWMGADPFTGAVAIYGADGRKRVVVREGVER